MCAGIAGSCRSVVLTVPSTGVEPTPRRPIAGLLLRRAVLGTLLGEAGPLTVREVADRLHDRGVTTGAWLTKSPSRVIADLLAHQSRIGTVRKVAPATFVAVPNSMSYSTRWRCRHWQRWLPPLPDPGPDPS